MITIQAALNRLIDNNELFYDEMLYLMRQIMTGNDPGSDRGPFDGFTHQGRKRF